ncbi:hypothetical protein CAPTEDRAFT_194577 [Capitella teleta]|uniref:EF-hand domain-containing protein n=1 Tax=Capitella teleta TaxID=283909 RepID=R7UDU3_CAPTE|nr:hypothetical protein CAPTEDRAFT_194577 [Capitella teleta]|eukprot:ELU04281.1 hypothetical protein CAPTEDRAFT_194577 [Capitella teleta]
MDGIEIRIGDEEICDDFEEVLLNQELDKKDILDAYLKRKSKLNLPYFDDFKKPDVLIKYPTYTEYYENYGPSSQNEVFEEEMTVVEEVVMVQEKQEELPITSPGDIYRKACVKYGAKAYPHVASRLKTAEVNLSHQHFDIPQLKALCVSFEVSDSLSSSQKCHDSFLNLNLSDASLTPEGTRILVSAIGAHSTLTDLDISNNALGSLGAKYICEFLTSNSTLMRLILSGNGFGERDAILFAKALKKNRTLKILDLSHNEFREKGGLHLAMLIAYNRSLLRLSLAWNHLRLKGSATIANALKCTYEVLHNKENVSLVSLDLSWNGFANEGAKVLAHSLVRNKTLQELNLTSNRIEMEGGFALARGIARNTQLKILRVSRNPITITGVCFLLKTLKESAFSSLEVIEVLGVDINRQFEALLEELHSTRPLAVIHDAQVSHGGVYAQRKRKLVATPGDPLALLMEFVKKSGLRLFDLFAQLDKDNSMTVSKAEFRSGVKAIKVPMTETQIDQLVDRLDADKDGEISFSEFLEGQRQFRARVRRRHDSHRPNSSVNREDRPRSSLVNMTRQVS